MKTRIIARVVIGASLIIALVLLNLQTFRHAKQMQTVSGSSDENVRRFTNPAFKKYTERIEQQIGIMRKESTQESMDALSVPDMYFRPGPTGDESATPIQFPFPSWIGERDAECIMSNRRVLKVFQELAELPNPNAAQLIRECVPKSLNSYNRLVESYIRENKRYFPPDAKIRGSPSFAVGNSKEPTVVGARFQLLSFVFLAGNLKLREAGPTVATIARQGADQYQTMLRSKDYHIIFRCCFTEMATLYNRQILAVGLLGTVVSPTHPVSVKYAGRLKTRKLTHFDARVTPYDQAKMMGTVDIDFPEKPLELRYLEDVSDEDFQEILHAAAGH